jgi:hypothetical protein
MSATLTGKKSNTSGDPAFHVADTPAIYDAFDYLRSKWRMSPSRQVANRNNICVSIKMESFFTRLAVYGDK